MCGITGFAGKTYNRDLLKRMNQTLFHRGPDEAGYYLAPEVGLAMRRLSIIDVKGGHQPIANEDETIRTVFNGEIYNFLELRKELIRLGHRFRTDHSDTEVIVHAYEAWGENFVQKLNGMFAIAIWDEPKKRLILYRDRIGEKPLYFWRYRNQIFFASEMKAILSLPFFSRKVNEQALFYYLSLKHAPREQPFFEGIESLAPGEKLVFERGKFRRSLYWEIDASKPLRISEPDAAAEIMSLLKSSVRYRMVSDVPLGAYLSGGVDSSAVVGLMSRQIKKPVETFSLTYEDDLPGKAQDELWAGRMAKKFHTKHRIYRMKAKEFQQDFDRIVEAFDEPFGGTISTFFLSKLIRNHVTVAISGDGADELFGSYKAHRLAYPIFHLNQMLRKGIDPNRLSAADKIKLAPFQNEIDYLMQVHAAYPYEWHSRLGVFSDMEKHRLLNPKLRLRLEGLSVLDYFKKAYKRCRSGDPLNQVLQMECQNLLPDQVLAFVDRLSMAHSVEVRPPFLDHRLIEFAFRLPGTMKIKQGMTKYILKKAVGKLLPQDLLNRPKEGFILPYHFWMQKYLYAKIRQVLSPKALDQHGYFNKDYVAALLKGYQGGDLSQSNKIYLLLMFQVWWQKYIKEQA
jgi:asparagine synthase (glutamine-hydrolysing)